MKQIKINSILSNFENETVNVEALAKLNEKDNTITYVEEELEVKITILNNKIIIERINEDYNLKLEFVKNETIMCKYIVKTIGLDMNINVHTNVLEIDNNRIYINYDLYNENIKIGTFEYKLMIRE